MWLNSRLSLGYQGAVSMPQLDLRLVINFVNCAQSLIASWIYLATFFRKTSGCFSQMLFLPSFRTFIEKIIRSQHKIRNPFFPSDSSMTHFLFQWVFSLRFFSRLFPAPTIPSLPLFGSLDPAVKTLATPPLSSFAWTTLSEDFIKYSFLLFFSLSLFENQNVKM